MEFKKKQREEQQKLKELQAKAGQKGPLRMQYALIKLNLYNSNMY